MKWYDVWGTEQTYNHMSAGWSWAFDTPFTWFKQNASKLGGIPQCMAVSWPGHIKDKGGSFARTDCRLQRSLPPRPEGRDALFLTAVTPSTGRAWKPFVPMPQRPRKAEQDR
jgi:hypothetical protein